MLSHDLRNLITFRGDKSDRFAVALLVILFAVLYVAILGVRPLFIPDEVRYGEIAREMLANGNWIVPRLNGLLYFEKPPFGHWLNALSLFVFGENPFAVRFASAMAAAVSAITVALVTRRLFDRNVIVLLSVFVYLTTLEVQAIATFSVLDSMFSATLNGGIAAFLLIVLRPQRQPSIWPAVIAGLFFGLAFLTKGFLAFALPILILAPWLMFERNFALLIKNGSVAAAVASIVVLPWAIAIQLQQPDFWRYFFWVEHIQRFAGENAQHKEPFYYYLVLAPVALFPWIGLGPAVAAGLRYRWRQAENRRTIQILVLWFLVPFAVFSVASGKLITYLLPCFVPLSILFAVGLANPGTSENRIRAGLIFNTLIYVAVLAAIVIVQFGGVGDARFESDEMYKLLILCGALLIAILVSILGTLTRFATGRLIAAGLSFVPVLIALVFTLPDRVMQSKAPEDFLLDAASDLPASALVATNGSFVRAVSWSLKRDDVYVIGDGGETSYGLEAPDGQARSLDATRFGELANLAAIDGRQIFLVCRLACPTEYTDLMPPHSTYTSYGNFYAWRHAGGAR